MCLTENSGKWRRVSNTGHDVKQMPTETWLTPTYPFVTELPRCPAARCSTQDHTWVMFRFSYNNTDLDMLAHQLTAVVTWLAPIRTLNRMPTAPRLSWRNRISQYRFRNLYFSQLILLQLILLQSYKQLSVKWCLRSSKLSKSSWGQVSVHF